MRRLALLLVAVFVLAAVAPAQAKRQSCMPHGSHGIARNEFVRVYSQVIPVDGQYITDGEYETDYDIRLYGCRLRTDRPLQLAHLTSGTRISNPYQVQIVGNRVAFSFATTDEIGSKYEPGTTPTYWRVEAFNLLRGKRVVNVDEGTNEVSGLKLAADGRSLAWTAGTQQHSATIS